MPLPVPKHLDEFLRHVSIPGLIRYVVLFNALVFVLHLLAPGYTSALALDPVLVLQGQVWRLVTWIFIPETLSPFWIFFSLLFLLYLGDGLESAMGPGKLTRFYLSGVILCTAVSFLFSLSGDRGAVLTRANTFLNLCLLLAFATVYPDFKVLVFFVLPIRIVWLALFSAILMILSSLGQPSVVPATLGAVFLNYVLFFRKELLGILKSGRIVGGISRSPVSKNRFTQASRIETLHRCEFCGRTEATHPELEFRVTTTGVEYCRDHLKR